MGRWARLRREPLVIFAALALGLLSVDGLLRSAPPVTPSDATVAALERNYERRLGRPATPEERAALVQGWIDEELLLREAERLGLDRGDPVIRRRMVQKVKGLHRTLDASSPDDDILRAFRDGNPKRYRLPDAVGFDHHYWSAERHDDPTVPAAAAVTALSRGAEVSGEAFPYAGGSGPVGVDVLAVRYGAQFAAALQDGEDWFVAESRFGAHAVRVRERVPGRLPDVDELRGTLLRDWRAAEADRLEQEAIEALRARR